MTLTDYFIDGVYSLTAKNFSETTLIQAKQCLLDYIGVTLAGTKILSEKGSALLNDLGSPCGDATVIGFDRKTDIHTAVICNGLSSHVAELDDGHRFGMMHPGAPIISALLPVVEVKHLSKNDLLRGLIIGYETTLSLASMMQPYLKERGLHATAICGTIGAAAAIASALCFSKSQMKDAISAAAISAGGLLKAIEDGSELKPYNVGQAAHNGLIAAIMARAGFKGPDDVFSGPYGYLAVLTGKPELTAEPVGDEPNFFEQVYFKPYAACRHCHAPIDAAFALKTKNDISIDMIDEIEVKAYQGAVERHDHTDILNISSAKMSIPFSVAVALFTGRAGITEFTNEHIHNPALIQLVKTVKVQADPELSALVPGLRPAILRITTQDGQSYQARVDLPKGEPENPLSLQELVQKFTSLAIFGGKSASQAEAIIQSVWNDQEDLSGLFNLI